MMMKPNAIPRPALAAAVLVLLLLLAPPALAFTDNAQGVDGDEKTGWIGTSGVVVSPHDDPARPGVRDYSMTIPSGGTAAFGFSHSMDYAAMTTSLWIGSQLSVFDSGGASKYPVASVPGWSGRNDHAALVFDNKMWVLGAGSNRNDVWCSSDGVTWTQVTSSAGWSGRNDHAALVFDNKMWVLGGYDGSRRNDVWCSSDGVTWTQVTSSAGWSGRHGHAALVFDNKMWVLGAGSYRNDVWCSSDGVTWTQVTSSAGWSGRYEHAALVFDNKMWVLGGDDGSRRNDVWCSSDGVTWTQVTSSAGWSGRYDHAALVFDNKMWVLGGYAGSNRNDVWCSSDGVTWTQVTSSAGWSGRYEHAALVFDNKMWVLGGSNRNDVWCSSDGVTWTPSKSRVELYRDSSNTWTAYIGGQEAGTYASSTPMFYAGTSAAGYADDLYIGPAESGYVLSALPGDWYLLKDPVRTPGLYNAANELVSSTKMVFTWGSPSSTVLSRTGDTRHADKIVLQCGNKVVHTTTLANTHLGYGEVIYDLDSTIFSNANAPYGLYTAKLYRSDGVVVDQRYFVYLPIYQSLCSVSTDTTECRIGDTVKITTTIDRDLYDTYTFTATIFSIDGETLATWDTYNGKTYNLNIDPATFEPGTHFVYLNAKLKNGGDAFVAAYTTFDVAETAYIHGTVYNAETGTSLAGATLSIVQGTTSPLTSDATGQYNISTLIANSPITFTASKDGYRNATRSFTPSAAKTYQINHYLYPTTLSHAENSTALAGLVLSSPYNQAVEGATVTVANTTYTTTKTASPTGYFLADNLAPGDYTVTATKDGWKSSTPVSVSATEGTVTTTDVQMSGIYSLAVEVRDATSHALIPDSTTIELQQDGTSIATRQATAGKATFNNLDYGIYTIMVSTEGYYTNLKNTLVDTENATTTIYLSKKSDSSGAGIQYPPHNVKFTLKTLWGAPVAGATITAQGFETTAGSWDWLKSLLGIDTDETPIQNAQMTGTTDTNGEINFMMIESVKYHVTITNGDQTQQFDVYPKDDYYPITLATASAWLPEGGDNLASIKVNVTTRTDTVGHITVHYNDTTKKTTTLTVQVTQKNATADAENVIGTYTVNSDSDVTHTFDISEYRGKSFFVRLTAAHPDFGEVKRDYGVSFKGVRVPLGNLDDSLYIYIAAIGLILIGCFFGATSATMGMIIVCFTGWIFFAFGWLDDLGLTGPIALSFATLLSIIAVVTKRYREEGYT